MLVKVTAENFKSFEETAEYICFASKGIPFKTQYFIKRNISTKFDLPEALAPYTTADFKRLILFIVTFCSLFFLIFADETIVRYDKKLSKAYLEGRYWAIPVFKSFSFAKGGKSNGPCALIWKLAYKKIRSGTRSRSLVKR